MCGFVYTQTRTKIFLNLLLAAVVLLNLLRNAIMFAIGYLVPLPAVYSFIFLLVTRQVISLIGKVNSVRIHNTCINIENINIIKAILKSLRRVIC